MRNNVVRVVTLSLLSFAFVGVNLLAQGAYVGHYSGHMVPPGLEVPRAFPFDFVVERSGNQYKGALTWESGGEYTLADMVIIDSSISFSWQYAGTPMDCRLEESRPNVSIGGCVDDIDQVGPMMIMRVGTPAEASEMSRESAYEVLGIQEPEPEPPRKQQVEKDDEGIAHAVPIGRTLVVDGLETNLLTKGTGDITVVLEAGVGEGLRVWRDVIDGISEFASVLTYDRPGIGYSEMADHALSLDEMVERLRNTLEAANAAPPYVLVGHDTGAYITRLYATRYPEEVAGIVLVHPAHERQESFWIQLDPDQVKPRVNSRDAFFLSMPKPVSDEYAVFSEISKAGAFEASIPEVPFTVITGGFQQTPSSWIGDSERGRAVLRGLHGGLAAQSSQGKHIVAEEAGVYVQNVDPETVISAIRDIVVPSEE